MKKFYSLLAAAVVAVNLQAQTTVYSENMGTPSATTAISANTFQNSGVTYSGSADVRVTTVSTGYAGASGGGNIFFAGTAGTNFVISGINTTGYTNLVLSFGHLKSTNASSNELTVEVSEDGTTWTPLTYSRATGGGSSNVWALITASGTIPAVPSLKIRFTNTITGQFRLDDVKLVGTTETMAVGDTTKGKANLVKNTIVANELIFGASAKVSVYNTAGQVVKTAEVAENSRLDVSALPKGTYVVTGLVNGQAVSQKVIKK
ncbi:T9SS type A sorting domain-containing protein [Epilithonimonas zeae]|uniref:T9SS type A sorting domain-containing protein n=1 Tax=Epilithonimonas zeae TaxID=1416779 RepID=UPI00200C8296|nr:T9SS type A sorting domain-containing protein [Epilithonimonas zeae]UQB70382.1 T9SS type A sorting domain-containing protein [Epilithonimonas zeae]